MILKRGFVRVALPVLAASIMVVPGCSSLGGVPIGGTGGDGRSSRRSAYINGEVRAVDTRRDRIHLRDAYGDTRAVRYDRRTQVVYGRRQYPVAALERGDLVRLRVIRDGRGRLVADRVDVRQSVRARRGDDGVWVDRRWDDRRDDDRRWGDRRGDDRRWDDRGWNDRPGANRRVAQLAGTVERVDARRGYFTLDPGRARTLVVRVPGRLRRQDAHRLERLRRGDRVRVEVRPLNAKQVALVRFR